MTDLERLQSALTTIRHEWRYLDDDNCPPSVLAALRKELPHLSPAILETQLNGGAVYVNGLRIESDLPLVPPVKLEFFEPKAGTDTELSFDEGWVVFEDDDLLAVVKPAGLTAMPARDQKYRNLKALIEKRVGAPIHMPSRLDTSTTGVVVISKTPRMHGRLQHIFERRRIEKLYLAEVTGVVDFAERTVDTAVDRDPTHQVLRRVVATGGKRAVTTFRVVKHSTSGDCSTTILAAYPVTGRTHQIRVHTAHLGFPIVGDNFYGGRHEATLHLLCFRLSFPHPLSGIPLTLEVPPHHLPPWALEIGPIA